MLYKHDCDRCVFLGSWRQHDIYRCEQKISEIDEPLPTFVFRFGNDGPDYFSGPDLEGLLEWVINGAENTGGS